MSNPRQHIFRQLPAVHQLLDASPLGALRTHCTQQDLSNWARSAVDQCRQEIAASEQLDDRWDDADFWLRRAIDVVHQQAAQDLGGAIQPVWNATGVILHTNLGRAPLAPEAAQRAAAVGGAANVELNLEHGRRSQRGERAHRLLAELTGAEDALIVNNCAAATLLVLQSFAQGQEVVIARSQLVEIGGGFRLPEVFTAAHVQLREVGTTNRTYLSDYEAALTEQTGALLRVHRSNFWQSGFVTEPPIETLAQLAQERGLPCIDDLGSGCVHDLSPWGLQEPTVQQSIAAGASVSLFSGDKLFGGPQCGMIVGSRECIAQLRKHPMMRALRADKLILAALEATLELHLSDTPFERLPVLRMIAEPAEDLRLACQALTQKLNQALMKRRLDDRIVCSVVETQCAVGGGTVPNAALPSFAVRLAGSREDALAQELRRGHLHGAPPIQSRVADGAVWLELRTLSQKQRADLSEPVSAAIARWAHNETQP